MQGLGPIVEKHDTDLKPPYIANGKIEKVDPKGKHLATGIEANDVGEDGKPIPKWKLWYAKAMLAWVVLGKAFLVIQAVEIFTSKNAAGVSLAAYIVYIIGSVIWLIYGAMVLQRKNLVIVVSAATAIVMGVIVLIGVIMYGDAEPDCTAKVQLALEDFQRFVESEGGDPTALSRFAEMS